MAIETTAVVINDLNPEYPFPNDYISEGDDHIKLIKQVVKNTFPTANTPLTPDFSYFNKQPDYLDFTTRNINGADVKILEVQDARITGALAGTDDTDVAVLKQVRDLISTAFRNIYDVGAYWVTDSNRNPSDVFGFGTWVKVTGMLMGSGIVYPDGSVPNQSARTFVVGEKGGSFSRAIKEENIPQITSDFANNGIRVVSGGRHNHKTGVESVYNGGESYRLRNVPGAAEFINGGGITADGGDHVHGLEGILRLGRPVENLVPVDVMNPYQVTNIWKRTS